MIHHSMSDHDNTQESKEKERERERRKPENGKRVTLIRTCCKLNFLHIFPGWKTLNRFKDLTKVKNQAKIKIQEYLCVVIQAA